MSDLTTIAQALVVWASVQSGLPTDGSVPPIKQMSTVELNTISAAPDGYTVQAFFQSARPVYIALNETWNADNPEDRAYLVHELVHYLQYRNRQWAYDEGIAYRAQMAYLCHVGVKPASLGWRLNDLVYLTDGTYGNTLCPLPDKPLKPSKGLRIVEWFR